MNRRTPVLSLALIALLTLTGCTTAQPAEPASEPSSEVAAWPRTLTGVGVGADSGGDLTLNAPPERVAALDYESAEVLAELGWASHLVLIPEAVLNPALGSHIAELETVAHTFPVAMEVDAEQLIALQPDLVVMSPRHGSDDALAGVLAQAGVPTLMLPSSWTNSDDLMTNIGFIGEAVGAEQPARDLTNALESGMAEAGAAESTKAAPRVLMLTNQAGRPFVTSGHAYPIELLKLAGAENAADTLGFDRTGPISAEQVIQANPDGVVLIDMNGTGDRMFTELLQNPAVQTIPAIAESRVLRVTGSQVQALGLTSTIDGLTELTEWVDQLN